MIPTFRDNLVRILRILPSVALFAVTGYYVDILYIYIVNRKILPACLKSLKSFKSKN